MPPYDAEADLALLKEGPSAARDWLRSAALRPKAEINQARDVAELWHWRSRTRELIEKARPLPEGLVAAGFRSYDDIIKLTVTKAAEDGVTSVIDDDFSLKGKAYRALTDDEWSKVRSITIERHFALNWLCGLAPKNRWDETPTET